MARTQNQTPAKFVSKEQRLRAGGWSITPAALLSSGLSDGAIRVYAALDGFVRSSKDSFCSPNLEILGKACNKPKRTLQRHLQELASKGFISIKKNGETGRNVYHFLEVLTDTKVPDLARCSDTKVPDLAGCKVPDLAGCSKAVPIKGNLNRRKKKAASNTNTSEVVPSAGMTTEQNLAAAFLTKHFDRKTVEKLLREHGVAKILHVKRQFAVRESDPKNPPGLIRYALRQPVTPEEAQAVANELVHAVKKRQWESDDAAERARKRRKATAESLQVWLERQPDKEELVKRATADVRLRTKGKADFRTVRRMTHGFLERLRKKSDREIRTAAMG